MTERKHRSGKTLLFGVLLLLAAAIWCIIRLCAGSADGISGATNEQRIAYINSFGWDAGLTHTDVKEVRIPVRFDEAYEQYNALQKEQGFDLRKYRACSVKQYTYSIGEDSAVPIYAHLLVLDGEIIGADISSAEADGFVTVLAKDKDSP
ncbi:MAG: DUF4830 domain-containing protein [Oscillospiraceae bacterium]